MYAAHAYLSTGCVTSSRQEFLKVLVGDFKVRITRGLLALLKTVGVLALILSVRKMV